MIFGKCAIARCSGIAYIIVNRLAATINVTATLVVRFIKSQSLPYHLSVYIRCLTSSARIIREIVDLLSTPEYHTQQERPAREFHFYSHVSQ